MWQLVLIGTILALLFYLYAIKPLTFWKERGVIQGKPIWFFGNSFKQFFQIENYADVLDEAYKLAPNERYVGFYQFTTPNLLIKDTYLLKQITVKDFDFFINHKEYIPEKSDPLWGRNLFALKDQKWREIRSLLSPFFTTSRMKALFTLMNECAEHTVKHFFMQNTEVIDVTMKSIASRFTNDIIATTVMGVHVNSIKEPENEFYQMGKMIADWGNFWKMVKFLFISLIFPNIHKFIKLEVFSGKARKFFSSVIQDVIKQRQEQEILRPDLLNLLVKAQKQYILSKNNAEGVGNKPVLDGKQILHDISIEEMTAHALIFFTAGFDSSSGLICFMAYELAVNPQIQKKLRTEIEENLQTCNGNITYEVISKMKYLDMVIAETLRKWPSFVATDRVCTKTYVIQPELPEEKPLLLNKGTVLNIPIFAIQNDPKYFPNPEQFNPERFSDKNKEYIDPFAYIPFGAGPRVCIGTRFAILETKVFFTHLLQNFEIIATSKTKIPFEISKKNFNLYPKDGIKVGFKRLVKINDL